MTHDLSKEDIRIGTLVNSGAQSPAYIKQIQHHGFESYSLTFWQTIGDTDLAKLAEELKPILAESGAVISSLGIFGNPLEQDELDQATLKGWQTLIDNAHLFDTDIVAGFTGRLRGKAIHESIPRFKEVWTPLADQAGEKGVKLAFENCDMGGTWASGDWNIAHNPTAWALMFDAVPHTNMGLEWEPCHQMVSLIDPIPQLKEWVGRIFHVHGKDATIHWDVIKKYGIHSSAHADPNTKLPVQLAPTFVEHRTPGFGDSNWADIITELRRAGFTGSIDIEGWHDPIYQGELEMTGQVRALNYLKECRGGSFVANPTV
jgi:sugar phosphate isomerase/epimerase